MKTTNYSIYTTIVIFILFCSIYGLIAYILPIPQDNDIYGHASIAKEMLQGERSLFSGPFIIYILSISLSSFSENIYKIMGVICLLLAVSTTLKFIIAQKEILKISRSNKKKIIGFLHY